MATLLDTISGDESLALRLAAMPSDSKTITLSFSENRFDLQHPHWSVDTPSESELQQTIDTSVSIAELRADEGFVPPRRVVSLGQSCPLPTRNDLTGECLSGGEVDDVEYRLIGKLGSGGTGIVYQAHQRAIDREVAVKVLRHELATDRQSRHRFLTEARVIGSLDHPNVIALHDLCIDSDGHLFYAMKRIDGTSWDQQIDQFSVEENLTILLRIADAIRYAHSRGLVHRDIKPENVMLGRFGEALLADWGLAVQLHGASTAGGAARLPATGSAIGGTPAYMAPEQAVGDLEAINCSTDVYLLGAILYQILTGQPPHHGKNLLACIHAAANNEIQPTEVVGELIDAAMTAMATDPSDRYVSVEQFIHAITDHRTHQESERLVRRAKRRVWPDAAAITSGGDKILDPEKTPQAVGNDSKTNAKSHSATDPDSHPAPSPEQIAENSYERFRISQALLHEALDLWPENAQAKETLKRVQLEFARFTAGQGDLDLSLRLYVAAGQGDCEAAARVRRERDRRDRMRESQAKYSALFTQSPEAGLLIRWQDGVVMEANTACLEMLGYEEGELVSQSIASLSIWACPDRRVQFVEALNQNGRVENFETQFATKRKTSESTATGSPQHRIDVLISSRTVQVNGVELLLSTIRDITQRREAERDLEQSRRRLRDLQRLAGLATWSYDPLAKKIHWSEETFQLTGRDPEKGEPFYEEFLDLIHPDDREKLRVALLHTMQDGASYKLRFRQRDDDGNYRPLLTRGEPVIDNLGNTTEIYGILLAAPGE